MTPRERILKVLQGETPDRVPFSFKLVPAQVDVAERETGTRDYAATRLEVVAWPSYYRVRFLT